MTVAQRPAPGNGAGDHSPTQVATALPQRRTSGTPDDRPRVAGALRRRVRGRGPEFAPPEWLEAGPELRARSKIAPLSIDLDHCNRINGTLGHVVTSRVAESGVFPWFETSGMDLFRPSP